MSDIVLEQRVSEVENKLRRISQKTDDYGNESHERMTRLEDWLIQYSMENQKTIDESKKWRKFMEESFVKSRNESERWRKSMEESHRENEQGLAELRRENERGFKELRQSLAESQEESRRENERGFKELRQIIAKSRDESERWRKSMQESHRENEQGLAELRRENERGFKELRQSLAETQEESRRENKELRKKIADSRTELGQISHRLGTVVEDLVAPSLPRIFRQIVNCPADEEILINVRIRRRHPIEKGKMLEIDAIADCGSYVLFNETKSQMSPEKVKAFLDKLAIVKDYFPEFQNHQIIGCISSLYLDNSLIEYASRRGLLALASGEFLMTVQNKAGFTWKAF